LDRLEAQNGSLRQATHGRHAIDRITEFSDLELGLRALLGGRPPRG